MYWQPFKSLYGEDTGINNITTDTLETGNLPLILHQPC